MVSRPPKRVGRGLKQLREVPIADVARELHLNLHQIDTFTGWHPPTPDNEAINLIIAVSFGLFVPPRILNAAKYGGLNVHPSMLPDFRGSSPLQHTIIHGLSKTGISVQTLDSKKFDHGVILAQTPNPGLDIPNPDEIDVEGLTSFLAPKGAEMLLQIIRGYRYVPPLDQVNFTEVGYRHILARTATKLTTEDRHINWGTWSADEILRKHRAIGPLWNHLNTESGKRRVIWIGDWIDIHKDSPMADIMQCFGKYEKDSSQIIMRTCDGGHLWVEEAKLDGGQTGPADRVLERAKLSSVPFFEPDQPAIFFGQPWQMPE